MTVSSHPLASLLPSERAAFATTSRLLSCLITESLSRALYFPLHGFEATGITVVFNSRVSLQSLDNPYDERDLLAIVPLRHVPIFKHDSQDPRGREIGLLDPLDMMPLTFDVIEHADEDHPPIEHADLIQSIIKILSGPGWTISKQMQLHASKSPLQLWEKFASSADLGTTTVQDISEELMNSVKWQAYSYEHPPATPMFTSTSIDWEQSIVEGHPVHPMHKMRSFLPPLPDFAPGSYDLYHPKLRLVAVPRADLEITNDFEEYMKPILCAVSDAVADPLVIWEDHVIVPVHELQVVHIEHHFPGVKVYPEKFSIPLLAQMSIRSVVIPNLATQTSFKFSLGIKLTAGVRAMFPMEVCFGPRFSSQVLPALTMDTRIVKVARELACVAHAHPDGKIARHCAVVIREAHENGSEAQGERLIVCSALLESGHAGENGHLPAVIRVFGLDNEDKCIQWLDRFVRLLFEAFLPMVLANGVAFECHPQNCVARFNIETQELLGFVIRDLAGMRVHPETLQASTGIEFDFLAGNTVPTSDLDVIYEHMYHTVFHNHLQRLIRVLGLHHNGKGWAIVRSHLRNIIPRDHRLYNAWLSPEVKTFPGKCLLWMKMSEMAAFHLHKPFPNLIQYEGAGVDSDS
ncbi:IucC family-domain-containing protein [Infundibulicybe gibba]|nr:IucC family-domain-containing protein [Infundibulicybe gibba]